MKKTNFALAVMAGAAVFGTGAYAQGVLPEAAGSLIELPYSQSAYYFGKVVNDTQEDVVLGEGILIGYNAAGETLLYEEYITTDPVYMILEPGEFTYIRCPITNEMLEEDDVAAYDFTIGMSESAGSKIVRHEGSAAIELDLENPDNNYVVVTITNDTEDIPYEWYTYAALYDENNDLVYVLDVPQNIGIHQGSTVSWKYKIDSEIMKFFLENDIIPISAEGFAYTIFQEDPAVEAAENAADGNAYPEEGYYDAAPEVSEPAVDFVEDGFVEASPAEVEYAGELLVDEYGDGNFEYADGNGDSVFIVEE